MKKICLILVIALIFPLALMGFTKGETTNSDVTLKVVFSTGAEQEEMRIIADEFTSETGIRVTLVERLHTMDAKDYIVNYAETAERPDIILMQGSDIGELSLSGYLMPITVTEDLSNRYLSTAFEAFSLNGVTYGVGYSLEAGGLVYNKALISKEELPTTWEEFFEIAREYTIKDGENIVQYGSYINPTDVWNNYPLIEYFGGYYFGKHPNGEYNAYDVGFNNEGMIAYCDYLLEQSKYGIIQPRFYSGVSLLVQNFCNNNVAMMVIGFKQIQNYIDAGIDYGIALLPDSKDGSPSLAVATCNGFVINNFSYHKTEAQQFLDYVLQDDCQQRLIEAANGTGKTGFRPPTNISVLNSDYVVEDELFSAICETGYHCQPWPTIPESTIWYNYTNTALNDVFYNGADVKTKLDELQAAVERDIVKMNKQAEYVPIPVIGWVLLGVVIALATLLIILKKRANKKRLIVREKYKTSVNLIAWGLMTPLILLLGVFYAFPILHNIYLSMTDYSGLHLRDYQFVGMYNYREIFMDGLTGLAGMTVWTFAFALLVVGISFVFGTFLATLLDKVKAKVAKFYRIVFILPWVIPSVITLLMWSSLLSSGGIVNQFIKLLGMAPVKWLDDPIIAKFSSVFVMVWFSFPYYMVVAFSFIQAIPKEYYEAARVDGASGFKQFVSITLPLVFKAILPTLIMGFIMQFNQFGIYMLTGGGPFSEVGKPGATDLLITYVFNLAFNSKRYGLAAAYSVFIFLFIAVFALVAIKIGKSTTKDGEER